jgi:transcriptional regulator with XRE-family HTH domain
MPRTSNKTATKIDKLVGTNIRVHRRVAGLTQEALGAKLGVTFQQVQKYENGTNRVGSGRLYQIAELFEIPVTSLFGGEEKQKQPRRPSPFDLLSDDLTLRMAKEFSKISNKDMRRAILAVVEILVA